MCLKTQSNEFYEIVFNTIALRKVNFYTYA